MKICIINDGFNMGGVERVSIELANSFSNIGHSVKLIDFSGANKFYYNISEKVNIDVLKPRSIKRKIISKLYNCKYSVDKKAINIEKLYKEQISNLIEILNKDIPDVIILCQGILTSIVPLLKKRLNDIRIIAWQHNEYEIYMDNYYKKILDNYLLGLKQADLVVCLTNSDKEKFSNINNKTECIYNPLTISGDKKSDLSSKNIIFVGRLKIKQKGLDYLIEIAKELEEGWRIIVVGDGPDKTTFLNEIKKNNLENRFIIKGLLSQEELKKCYYESSVFISTSRWEGFGLVITEAMSFGLPIVSFSNKGPLEILDRGRYGKIIPHKNINKYIDSLNSLINNVTEMQEYQEKSLERVLDFNKNIIIKKWENNVLKLCR